MTSTCMIDDSAPDSDEPRPPSPASPPLTFDAVHARHWRVQPIFDPRPVPPELRGQAAPGHTERPETCPVCTPGARPLAARAPERRPPPIAVARPPEPPRRPRRAPVEPSEEDGETLAPTTAPTEAPPAVRRTNGESARRAPSAATARPARRPPPPSKPPVGMTLAEVFGVAPPAPPTVAPPAPRPPPWKAPGAFGEHLGSHANTVLLAAADLAADTSRPFAAHDLVVAAWQRAPEMFGLEGCPGKHPDSNKVLVTLSRRSGPVARGYLAHSAPRSYALTERGLRAVLDLRAGRLPDREGRPIPSQRKTPAPAPKESP